MVARRAPRSGGGEGASSLVTRAHARAHGTTHVATGAWRCARLSVHARASPSTAFNARARGGGGNGWCLVPGGDAIQARHARQGKQPRARRGAEPADADTWPGPHTRLERVVPSRCPPNVPCRAVVTAGCPTRRFTFLYHHRPSPAQLGAAPATLRGDYGRLSGAVRRAAFIGLRSCLCCAHWTSRTNARPPCFDRARRRCGWREILRSRVTTTRGAGDRRCGAVPRRASERAEREVASSQSSPSSPTAGWAGGPRACARTRAARRMVGWPLAPTAASAARADSGSGRTDRDASLRAGPTPPVTCSHNVPPYAPRGGPPSGGFDAFCLRNGIMAVLHHGTLLKPLFTY